MRRSTKRDLKTLANIFFIVGSSTRTRGVFADFFKLQQLVLTARVTVVRSNPSILGSVTEFLPEHPLP